MIRAELGGAEEEADLPRIVDNLKVIRVPLGPKGVHGSDAGLVLRVHVVEDARGPLRPVLPMPPRAAASARAINERPPSHVLVVILHPGRVARAHTSHRVESLIEVPRIKMDVRGNDSPVSLPADPRKATGRPRGHSRGARAPPIRGGLGLGPSRVTGTSKREAPVRPRPNCTEAEHLTVAAALADPMERVEQSPVPPVGRSRRGMGVPLQASRWTGRVARGRLRMGHLPRAAATSADDIGGREWNTQSAAADLPLRRVKSQPAARDLVRTTHGRTTRSPFIPGTPVRRVRPKGPSPLTVRAVSRKRGTYRGPHQYQLQVYRVS